VVPFLLLHGLRGGKKPCTSGRHIQLLLRQHKLADDFPVRRRRQLLRHIHRALLLRVPLPRASARLVGSVAREGRPTKPHDLSRLSDIDAEVALPFIPCWCCCAGLRLMPPSNCVDNYMRCLWCEYSFSTGMPDTEAGLCLHLVNCWCCYSLCKFPPTSRHNPLCACCGRVCIDRDHAKT
ncbi:unnamed protein product, partial [Effrenium voratum]